MRRALGALAWLCTIGAGCTFTGLGRYDLGTCGQPTSLADDPCRTLDDDAAASCLVYQCNVSTGRCEQRALDFDRDGDPSKECGGNDCDDHDPTRRSGGVEICDGIDNDCNGIRDDGLVVPLSATSIAALPSGFHDASLTAGGDVVGAAVNGTCVLAFRATGELLSPPCTFPAESNVAPLTPVARPIASGDVTFATMFVSAPVACPQGELAFRNTKDGHYDGACATEGAALPSFAPYADGNAAVATYVARAQTPLVIDCASVPAAPLDVLWLTQPAGAAPAVYSQRLALTSTLAIRPLPLVPRADAVLLAAPSGGAAALWALRAPALDGSGESVVPLSSGLLPGARAVDLALDDTGAHLALVGEIGCPPQSHLTMVLADVSDPGPVVTTRQLVDVGAGTTARVGWIAGRNEWWVSWVTDAGLVARRFTPDGVAASDPVIAGKALFGVPDPASSKGTSAVIDFIDAQGLGAAALGCH